MTDELVFYTNPMSRGRIVRWMLEEAGVPYRTELLDYASSMKSAAYLAVGPGLRYAAASYGTPLTAPLALATWLVAMRVEVSPPQGAPMSGTYRFTPNVPTRARRATSSPRSGSSVHTLPASP